MDADEQLSQQLSKLRGSHTLILGIGNTLKGDDGAGPVVCEKLRDLKVGADVIDTATAPENYIQPVVRKAPQNLLIVDAMDFGASAGTIGLFSPRQLSSVVTSTHTLSPRMFIDLVCAEIEVDVYFAGIQPAHTKLGSSVSPQVQEAIDRLCLVLLGIFPPRK